MYQYRHRRKRKRIPILLVAGSLMLTAGILNGEYLYAHKEKAQTAASAHDQPLNKSVSPLAAETQQTIVPHDELSENIQQQLVQRDFSGTALVYHNGKLILNKAYGWQNQEQQLKNQVTTQYCIGSVQKAQTAYLIMQAAKTGKLQLSDKLSKYYPQVKNSDNITLKDMLNMCSGLKPNEKIKEKPTTDEKAVLSHALEQVELANDKKYSYQPINYVLLAGILEQITQTDYYDLFNQKITKDFDLTHTSFAQDQSAEQARSYQETKGSTTYTDESAASYASELGTGNAFMSAGDLFLYFHSLISGEKLSLQARQTLWQNYSDEQYAGGIYNQSTYYHSRGVKANFETLVNYSKDGQNALILISNKHIENTFFNDLGDQLFNQLTQNNTAIKNTKLPAAASSKKADVVG